MLKKAMDPERVHGDRHHAVGVIFMLIALVACSAAIEAVAKKGRHQDPPSLLGRTVEILLPSAIRGDWSSILGDGIPGVTTRGSETLVAWVRPHRGTIEVRLLRRGVLALSQSLPAPGAYGTPFIEAPLSGWSVGWTGATRSLRLWALDDQLTPSIPLELGHGICLANVAVGQTAHHITLDQAQGLAVWTVSVNPIGRLDDRALAFPDVPIIIDPPTTRIIGGLRHRTSLYGGLRPELADWKGLSIFATEPCEVVHGPNVTLAWELPAPDAGAISLELDEAGVVSGFDLLPGLPKSCGKSRGPRSSGR